MATRFLPVVCLSVVLAGGAVRAQETPESPPPAAPAVETPAPAPAAPSASDEVHDLARKGVTTARQGAREAFWGVGGGLIGAGVGFLASAVPGLLLAGVSAVAGAIIATRLDLWNHSDPVFNLGPAYAFGLVVLVPMMMLAYVGLPLALLMTSAGDSIGFMVGAGMKARRTPALVGAALASVGPVVLASALFIASLGVVPLALLLGMPGLVPGDAGAASTVAIFASAIFPFFIMPVTLLAGPALLLFGTLLLRPFNYLVFFGLEQLAFGELSE